MKRVWTVLLCVALVALIGAVALAAAGAITDEPNDAMKWIVTLLSSGVAIYVVNWAKKALVALVGEELGTKLNQFVSWVVAYGVAMVGWLVGGIVTGIDVWGTLLNNPWAIFTAGSTVSILANLVYNAVSAVAAAAKKSAA